MNESGVEMLFSSAANWRSVFGRILNFPMLKPLIWNHRRGVSLHRLNYPRSRWLAEYDQFLSACGQARLSGKWKPILRWLDKACEIGKSKDML